MRGVCRRNHSNRINEAIQKSVVLFKTMNVPDNNSASQATTSAVSQHSTGKFHWTDAMTRAMLEEMLNQVVAGKAADNGFKKEAWKEIVAAIQPHCLQIDEAGNCRIVTQRQASNKRSELKTAHAEWWALQKESSGFGIDPVTGCITGDNTELDLYFEVR